MSAGGMVFACIGGSFAHELLSAGRLQGKRLPVRSTPFGKPQPIYKCKSSIGPSSFYLLLRHSEGSTPIASSFVNYRANIYALKQLGVTHILSWSAARAVSHNYGVGQIVLVNDLIDETRRRAGTFFEHGALVNLRQWPVFCPTMRSAVAAALDALGLRYTDGGTYLCSEGPRRETRAEVQKYAMWNADLLGDSLAPETFLAKELQMCYASLCFVIEFAETGSDHRPFEAGSLFDGLEPQDDARRSKDALAHMSELIGHALDILTRTEPRCRCREGLSDLIDAGVLKKDFRPLFKVLCPVKAKATRKSARKPTRSKRR